jgi:hypothetical protein
VDVDAPAVQSGEGPLQPQAELPPEGQVRRREGEQRRQRVDAGVADQATAGAEK